MPRRDDYDDEDRPRRPRRRRDDDDYDDDFSQESPVSTIIPYKNGMALVAYYCGVFGLIPCLLPILGPAALILGILGLRYVRLYPTAHGTGHAIAGIVLGSIESLLSLAVLAFSVAGMLGAFK